MLGLAMIAAKTTMIAALPAAIANVLPEGAGLHARQTAKNPTNTLKIAPLSPPSRIDNPTARPARMLVRTGCMLMPASIAANARNVAPRDKPRVPRPQAALEKKFVFSAAAIEARIAARELQPICRKKTNAQRPRMSAVLGA